VKPNFLEIIYEDFEFGTYERPIEHAWDYYYKTIFNTKSTTFAKWLKETHNLEYTNVNHSDIKISGKSKDITCFLMRWS
jgi:hypothetical protein